MVLGRSEGEGTTDQQAEAKKKATRATKELKENGEPDQEATRTGRTTMGQTPRVVRKSFNKKNVRSMVRRANN